MPAARTFVQISDELLARLADEVRRGRSLALLGPRGSGKQFVLQELRQRARKQDRLFLLDLAAQRAQGPAGFAAALARELGVPPRELHPGQSLAGLLEDLLHEAIQDSRPPAWVLVRGVLALPTPL